RSRAAGAAGAPPPAPERLARPEARRRRPGRQAPGLAGDATKPAPWWDGTGFERILIDAPCSGSGVLRRNPDIKWLRRDSDLPALVATQRQLLAALGPLVVAGGKLVSAACSVLPEENQ